jgi:hypothetical protein
MQEEHMALVIFLTAVALMLVGTVMYSRGGRIEGRKMASERAAMIMMFNNEVLRSWAAYSASQNIEGLPVGIEMTWDPGFDWLQNSAITIRQGFKDIKYEVVLKERVGKTWAEAHVIGSFTFEPSMG